MRPRPARLAMAVLTVSLLLPLTAIAATDDKIVGADGEVYDAAPLVIEGRRGDLFYGPSADLFCSAAGPGLQRGINGLSKLTRIIKASGREVVFTVVPDKALVNESNVIRSKLPHARCDKVGMKQQRKVLDSHADGTYLPIRKALVAEKRQTYWKTDLHWTTIGASVFARLLAARLDRNLGQRQKYKVGAPQTAVGLLNQLRGVDTAETVPSRVPATGVRVTPVSGTDSLDERFPFDHAWTAKPRKLTHPGRTLVIGDSFSLMAMKSLRPLFERGRFLWVVNVDAKTVVKAIRKADTVVIEVVHLFATVSPLGTRPFRNAVRRALK